MTVWGILTSPLAAMVESDSAATITMIEEGDRVKFASDGYSISAHSLSTAMAMSARAAMRKVADMWPADSLRPRLQLKSVLRSIADDPKVVMPDVLVMETLRRGGLCNMVRRASLWMQPLMKCVQYKLSNKMLQPPANPNYYNNVLKSVEQQTQLAASGTLKKQSRPWWKRLLRLQ